MISHSHVLAPKVKLEDCFAPIDEACRAVNGEFGTLFAYAGLEERDGVGHYMWPERLDGSGWIRLIDDDSLPALYLDAGASSEPMLDRIEFHLRDRLPLMNRAALTTWVRDSAEASSGALALLGISGQGPYDAEIRALLEAGLSSPRVEMRRSAALAAFLLKWRQMAPALQQALSGETDESLRLQLAEALAHCQASSDESAMPGP